VRAGRRGPRGAGAQVGFITRALGVQVVKRKRLSDSASGERFLHQSVPVGAKAALGIGGLRVGHISIACGLFDLGDIAARVLADDAPFDRGRESG